MQGKSLERGGSDRRLDQVVGSRFSVRARVWRRGLTEPRKCAPEPRGGRQQGHP